MEYTVQKLARLAGVSARTLRYYDEIGILKPARINSSGYRIYGAQEVARLQQILLYRELDVSLETIKAIMLEADFDMQAALAQHHHQLLEKRARLELLIKNVEKTMAACEGGIEMSDKERFEGLKQAQLAENEAKYGAEVRERYGEEAVEASNKRFANMTMEQHAEIERLNAAMFAALKAGFATGDAAGEAAQRAADLHRQWLSFFWPEYTAEAHRGVTQMYVDDERFTAYYDQEQPGLAAFLRDAVRIYTDGE